MTSALNVIKSEHRSLAAVLHGLLYLVDQIQDHGAKPDFNLFRTMLYYIDTFPERVHHPREDAYLFKAVRERTREADAVLDELEAEHVRGARYMAHLKKTLADYEAGMGGEFPAFASAIRDYAEFHWQHMRKEEDVLMPLAVKCLTAQDWEKVDAAFVDNNDPLFGVEAKEQYQHLFTRIVNLAPPPIGVGPAAGA